MKQFLSFTPPPLSPTPNGLEGNERSLITPRNGNSGQDNLLLTPPPAPMGICRNDRDLEQPPPCMPIAEIRQSSNRSNIGTLNNDTSDINSHDYGHAQTNTHRVSALRGDQTPPMLNLPLALRNFDLNNTEGENNQDSQSIFFRTITPSQKLSGRRRRANSVDDLPYPKITLRPRFSRYNNLSLPTYLRRRDNSCLETEEEADQLQDFPHGNNANQDADANANTHSHRRSFTYDGHSSILDTVFSNELKALVPPQLPSIPSGLDVSQLGRDLPESFTTRARNTASPPRTSLFIHPLDNANIPRPVPRYSTNRIPKQKISSSSPPCDRRYNFSASEANTTCTLSLSSHSAFGTPTTMKAKTHPTSPLTPSGSDSGTSLNGIYASSIPAGAGSGSKSGNSTHHHQTSSVVKPSSIPAFPSPHQYHRDDIYTMVRPRSQFHPSMKGESVNGDVTRTSPPCNIVHLHTAFRQCKNKEEDEIDIQEDDNNENDKE